MINCKICSDYSAVQLIQLVAYLLTLLYSVTVILMKRRLQYLNLFQRI